LISISKRTDGAMSTKNKIMVIFVALVLVLFAVLVALYGFVDPEGPFDDPVMQGDKDVGSVFTYEITEGGISITSFEVEIIAQSGSYYMIDLAVFVSALGSDSRFQMIHKETGALRFAEEGDETEFEFEGDTIMLIQWTLTGEEGDEWMFASCEDDGIIYVIECTIDDDTVRAELTSTDIIEPAGDYKRSSALDEYFTHSIEGIKGGAEVTGEMFFHTVAEAGNMLGYVQIMIITYEDEEGEEVEETFVGYEFGTMTLQEYLYDAMTFGGLLPPEGTEMLDTIDGEILCDRYHVAIGTDEGSFYLDPVGKMLYKMQTFEAGDEYTTILIEYNIPGED